MHPTIRQVAAPAALPLRALAAVLAIGTCAPSWAHVPVPAQPHLHASDLAGIAIVVALTALAGWIDRRVQRARRRTRAEPAPAAREHDAGGDADGARRAP